MMPTEHDEALVERVALAMQQEYAEAIGGGKLHHISESVLAPAWLRKARAVIYPPAPPKTRLQVARELLSEAYTIPHMRRAVLTGAYDKDSDMRAVLAALALPAMEE